MCHFLVEKICHCPNWVPELWRPLGWPETGTDLLRLLFVFHQYIYTHLLGVVSLRKLYFWISFLGICGFVCLDLSGVVGDNHLWEEISTIGSRCSHGPTPSSTPDRTPLESSQIFLFLIPNEQTYRPTKWGNVESESLSICSFSLHFLTLSPFPHSQESF